MNELMTKDNEWILHFMGSLDRLLDNYERMTADYRPTLGGERFFTDKEVSTRLKVSDVHSRTTATRGGLPISSWAARFSTASRT